MDTVEQLNGAYFYDGTSNLTAGELFFWILVDTALDHFGSHDIAALVAALSGLNIISVPGKPSNATPGTSYASKFSRKVFRNKKLPFPLPSMIGYPPNAKMIMTNKLGTFVGRGIPVVGYVILATDVATIIYKATNHYNLIANSKDQLW
jgi:hypothetical protein